MSELETIIKIFCEENAGKKDIDFKAFKNPLNFHNEFGGGLTYNKFKGEIFEKLLAELFRGNGWLVDRLGERGSDSGCDLLRKVSMIFSELKIQINTILTKKQSLLLLG